MYKNLLRAALAAWISMPLAAAAATPAKPPLKVAFVYVSPVGRIYKIVRTQKFIFGRKILPAVFFVRSSTIYLL